MAIHPTLPFLQSGSDLMLSSATRRAPLALALLLTGCSLGGLLPTWPDCASREGEARAEKPPPPHTLPQALRAYGKALRSQPCSAPDEPAKEQKNGDNGNGAEDKGKKSPPANGDKDEKDKDNGQAGEEKKDEKNGEKKEDKDEPKDA